MVQNFTTGDGRNEYVYYLKAVDSDKTLLVFHEWWGLNTHIKELAHQFANDLPGVNILAIDLYHGQVTDKDEHAAILKRSISLETANETIGAAISTFANGHLLASIGYCMGGTWALEAALLTGTQMKACVIYYGMPEMNVEILKSLQAPVLGIFGEFDPWISSAIVNRFAEAMNTAGKDLQYFIFPAQHAFFNPSNATHDPDSAHKAYALTLEFLKKKLFLEN